MNIKNQCKCCAGKFGLVRHYHWHQAFCSKRCLARFEQDMRRKVVAAREHFRLTAMDASLAHAHVAKIR